MFLIQGQPHIYNNTLNQIRVRKQYCSWHTLEKHHLILMEEQFIQVSLFPLILKAYHLWDRNDLIIWFKIWSTKTNDVRWNCIDRTTNFELYQLHKYIQRFLDISMLLSHVKFIKFNMFVIWELLKLKQVICNIDNLTTNVWMIKSNASKSWIAH